MDLLQGLMAAALRATSEPLVRANHSGGLGWSRHRGGLLLEHALAARLPRLRAPARPWLRHLTPLSFALY